MELWNSFIKILLFLTVYLNCLSAVENPSSLTDGLPSSIVNGTVNVITGEFLDSEVDLVMTGPEPVVLQRAWCNGEPDFNTLSHGWSFSHLQTLEIQKEKNKLVLRCREAGGHILSYQTESFQSSQEFLQNKEEISFTLKPNAYLTNCGWGPLSARYNPKNNQVSVYTQENLCTITSADNVIRSFKIGSKIKDTEGKLISEKHPNGALTTYGYGKKYKQEFLEQLQVSHMETGKLFGSLHFAYHTEGKHGKRYLYVDSSDGRRVSYEFDRFRPYTPPKPDEPPNNSEEEVEDLFYLTKVDTPDRPQVTYHYQQKEQSDYFYIVGKHWPDNRFLQVEYYREGTNLVAGFENVEVDKHSLMINRVKQLWAPVGSDGSHWPTHRFFYQFSEEEHDQKNVTTVVDLHHHVSKYLYDENNHLQAIKKFQGTFNEGLSLHSQELFLWKGGDGYISKYLKGKLLKDSSGQILRARYFNYDHWGNVTRERFYGDLTGTEQAVTLNAQDLPLEGCEHFGRYYTYTKKPDHLLSRESDDSGKSIDYAYVKDTNWLKSKCFSSTEGCYKREFFGYDRFGCVNERITDNGCGEKLNDLAGVTERLITKITNRSKGSAIGVPIEERDFYLNLDTSELVPLQTRQNVNISSKGEILKQEYYDANGDFCYSICRRFDAHGNKIFERNPLRETSEWQYDANDNLIFEQGPDKSWAIVHTYDYANRRISSALGSYDNARVLLSTYNGLSQRTSTRNYLNHLTHYFYNDVGDCIREKGPFLLDYNGEWQAQIIRRKYDAVGNITTVIDPLGNRTHKTYTARGQVSSITYPDGSSELFRYRLDGLLDFSQARNGLLSYYTYDGQGRMLSKRLVDRMGLDQGEELFTYDQSHLLSKTDPEGAITSYTYDGAGRLASETKDHRVKQHTYDTLGRLASIKEFSQQAPDDYRIYHYQYDLLGREIETFIEDAQARIWERTLYAYDPSGNKIEVHQESNGRIASNRSRYNFFNELVEHTDPEGKTIHIERRYTRVDDQGQRILEVITTDPYGHQTVEAYNSLGKVAEVTAYASFGHVIGKRYYQYDVAGNLRRLVDYAIKNPHDQESIALQTAQQMITEWNYNSMNQVIKLVEAVGTPEQKTTYTLYDSYGQKIQVTKPNGTEIYYAYDGKGRMIRQWSSDCTLDDHFEYDRCDRLLSIHDQVHNTTTQRTFDRLGNLKQEQLANGLTVSYEQDAFSRPIKVTLPDQSQIEYAYAGLQLQDIRRLDPQQAVRYAHRYTTFDSTGRILQEEAIANLGTSTYTYDLMGRVRQIQAPAWQEEIPEDGFDCIGNLVKRTWKDNLGTASTAYHYDALQHLMAEVGDTNHTYLYDTLHNRICKDGKPYLYNALNQLLSDGERSYIYNANGGMVLSMALGKNDTISYQYDALDRLIAVKTSSGETRYIYDALNRRIQKRVLGLNQTLLSIENYLFHGEDEVGATDAHKRMLCYRTLGRSHGAEVGRAIALELGDKVFLPLYDHLGSVTSLIDAQTKQVAETYRYSAFGEEVIFSPNGTRLKESAVKNPWRYVGKRVDSESGFIFFGRRAYNPVIGRWVSPDPKGLEAGPNLYAYVENSPMNRVDPYGLDWTNNSSYYDSSWNQSSNASAGQGSYFQSSQGGQRWYENSTFSKITSFIGGVLSFIGDQLIPIPGIRDVFSFAGHLLQGKKPYSYTADYRREHSSWTVYKHADLNNNSRKRFIGFVNGICNHDYDCYHSYLDVARTERPCYGVKILNASHGLATDVGEVGLNVINLTSNAVLQTREAIKSIFSLMDHLGCGTETLYLYAHSQGGLILDRALRQLSPELTRRIDVTTYGSAKMICRETLGLKRARNYINDRDPVPFIMDPIGIMLGVSRRYVSIIPSEQSWFDHSFLGTTYTTHREMMAGL